ncbi:hypothetical protein AB670_00478 [Chryseobacterium sp. MOF25P]|uniref:discoidin domain-containing protein n=1 Tax=unclassified Chryseobacterium TaxID=2593645 RepID=UPI00080527C2|nr:MULTISPECIES: discoidin domain-containing protein [unclassified Chryseobacterium]OBW43133.1 hypothetical protein AB670_00478 [Chryseobacterium sp. MOF25P]OBW45165.1 hypothetical protein AB671_02735 [Chryseobacterium sp. BGARF1]
MERFYTFIFKRSFLLLIVSFSYLSAQNTGPTDDFDGDGIINSVDIDDDNDGVPDATESPTCYYSQIEAQKITSVSSQLASYSTYVPANIIDNNASTLNAFNGAINWVGKELYRMTPTIPIAISSLELDLSTWALSSTTAMTFRLEGSVDGLIWTSLSGAVSSTATSGTFTVSNSLPNNIYGYYRLVGVAGTSYYGGVTEIRLIPNNYVPSAHSKTTCTDTNIDGDNILPHLDLDTDGDGCSDAFEASATSNLSSNYKFSGAVGANGLDNTLETGDNGNINYSSTYVQYAIISSIKACVDSDGDGIRDVIDIDDDNDGVPDATESPNCFYTQAEAQKITSVSSQLASYSTYVPANTIDGDVSTMNALNGIIDWVGKELYKVTSATPIAINSLQLDLSTWALSSTTAMTFRLEGSVDGLTWTSLSGAVSSTATTGTFTINNSLPNNKYGYYRLLGVSGTSYYGGVSEIKLIPNNYIPSANPKATCIDANIDSDNILPHLDLDTDGDGCSDAFEASATSNLSSNYKFSGAVGANGLDNTLETGDNGNINYSSTYVQYATTSAIKACIDSDGDGIRDVIDIDDDNDGILDTTEQRSLDCENAYDLSHRVIQWQSVNSSTMTGDFMVNGENISVTATTTKTFQGLQDAHWNFGTGSVVGCPDMQSAATNSAINIYTGDYTVTYTFSQPVRNPSLTFASFDTSVINFPQPVYVSGLQGNPSGISIGSYITSYPATENKVAVIYNGVYNSISFTIPAQDHQGSVILYIADSETTGTAPSVITTGSPFIYKDIDTDGDGIPNRLDLDSDGDGCSDLLESSVSPSTDVSTPSATNNTGASYGIAIAKIAGSQLNPSATDTNNDGLNDSVDSDLNGIPNYTSTYIYNALNFNYTPCYDTDGDGINDADDIDDDNDGVPDATESPSCFYTLSEAQSIAKVSSELAPYSTNTPANIIDSNPATYGAFTPSVNWVGKELYKIGLVTPVKINSIQLNLINWALSSSAAMTFKLQGSINGTNWDDLSAALASTASTGTFTITNNLSNNSYRFYRLIGVAGTSYYGGVTELKMIMNNYVSSANPKPNCTSDTDGDTIPNHRDLDSDNDGCSDLKESNVSPSTDISTPSSTNNDGGSYGIAVTSLTNSQLNPNAADVNNDGLNDSVDPDKNGVPNYTSSYFVAIKSDINGCTDTDGDAIADVFDLDDDNDGILDNVESNCSTIVINSAQYATSVLSSNRVAGSATSGFGNVNSILGAADGVYYSLGDIGSSITFGFGNNITTSGTNAVDLKEIEIGTAELTDLWLQPTPYTRYLIETNGFTLTYDTDGYAKIGALSGTNSDIDIDALFGNIFTSGQLQFTAGKLITTDNTAGAGQANAGADVDAIWALYVLQGCNQNLDTDNDGIPNRLDLDSDGDGCPDTKEAILYNNATEASINGNVQNGSGGAVTSTVSTSNAMVPGPYGSNGFADALQSTTNPDAYKQVYSYQFIATDSNISTCDNKFLLDIDSDDDGVPDAVESPSCFYTETQAMDIMDGVTSEFVWATTNPLSNTYDDNSTYGLISAPTATSIQNKALITFDLPVIDASVIDYVTLNVGATFGAGKWKLQGLDINTNTWTDLSALAGQALNSATVFTFNNTLQPTVRYHTYRILGVDNVNISNNARLIEFEIHYKNYNASLNRTKTGCNSDFDGDGVPNYIDRDTDGDGCPDAIEAGINKSLLVPANFYNIGGQVSGNYVIVGGNYGTNGLGDSVENPADSGIINYVSTYNIYARDNTSNLCSDTDNDGVADPIDIDDDNDGVLDAVESPTCFYTAAEANVILRISSQFASPDDDQSDRDIQILHDGSPALTFNFNDYTVAQNPTGSNLLTIEYLTPVKLATLVLSNRLSTTTGANAIVVGSQDGISWSAALSPATLITAANATTPVTFTVTTTLPYKYYKIQTGTVAGALATTNTVGEVTSTLTSDYTPSSHSKPGCTNDTDNDGILNHQDLDSDGDSCPDAAESGTATQAGASNTYSGTIVNVGGSSTVENAIVGAAGSYGANGFYSGIENNDTPNANYLGTYTYANAINALVSACFCYKPAVTAGTVLDTKHGITSLSRAGTDHDNWPMVRKGAWTVLEAKTKAFVPNVLTTAQITAIPSANLVKGMMVYNVSLGCLQINVDGTATGWKCFDKQTCPTTP